MTLVNYATFTLGATGAASQYYSSYVVANALDEDDGTFWRTTNAMTGQWYRVALLNAVPVSQVGMYYAGGVANLPTAYRVEWSDDDANWHLVGNYSRQDNPDLVTLGAAITAKYWRFTCLSGGGGAFCVTQFSVVADDVTPPEPDPCEPPVVPTSSMIEGWLDHVEENYVPAIAAWLAAQ